MAHTDGITLESDRFNVRARWLEKTNTIMVCSSRTPKTVDEVDSYIEKIPVVREMYSLLKLIASIIIASWGKCLLLIGFLELLELFIIHDSKPNAWSVILIIVGGFVLVKLCTELYRLGWHNVGFIKKIYTLFSFHGAEHKVILAYENGLKNDSDDVSFVQSVSRCHIKCGTNFVVIYLVLYALFMTTIQIQAISEITQGLMLVVLYGVAQEIFLYARKWPVLSLLGMAIQKYVVTIEPDSKQIEVGLAALRELIRLEGNKT